MRVATKVATGTGAILVLLIGVLLYQVSLLRALASANRTLGAVDIRAAMVSLELRRQLDRMEEYTRKYLVTRDPAYADMVGEARDAFAANLAQLKPLRVSGSGAAEVDRLDLQWSRFGLALVPRPNIAAQLSLGDEERLLADLADQLDGLRAQVVAVINATSSAIASQVSAAATTSQDAQRLAFVAVGVALALSGLILLVTVRSINDPLKRLTEATRQVADGSFAVQIDAPHGDEFANLAEDFNTMVRRLEELDVLKRGFVSHVSHELKTPLVAMQETNQLLLEETPGALTAKQRRFLELNLAASRRLSAMITNLLDLSRIEAGAMEYRIDVHDLGALAESAAALFEARAQERGLHLEVAVPAATLLVPCDADRVTQVLTNLLDNAVRHAPDGSTVRIRVSGAAGPRADLPGWVQRALSPNPPGTRYAEVTVEDEGHGVPDEHKERIFDKFHQVGRGRRSDGGVGLGLAISRETVAAHGGAIWVADRPGGGSVFTLLLPLTSDRTGRRSASRPGTNPPGGR
jgi:signal transduction histidine kinase